MASGEEIVQIAARVVLARGTLMQADFAAALGVDRKTVVRWEQAHAIPDGDSLLRLFLHFGANPGWLLTGDGEPPPLSARESSLLDNYRNASEAGRRALEQTGAALAQSKVVKKSA